MKGLLEFKIIRLSLCKMTFLVGLYFKFFHVRFLG